MTTTSNYIEEITLFNETIIKIKIIRLWKPLSYDDPSVNGSIEIVFIDRSLFIVLK